MDLPLVNYHSISLFKSDFILINGQNFLNDTIISFYYE